MTTQHDVVESTRVPESSVEGAPAPYVRGMFSRIASTYDLLNRVLSAGRDRAWRRIVAGTIDPHAKRVLDLCSGTGDLAIEIARQRPGARVYAGDFCFEMLERGLHKGLREVAPPATLDALRLPFADATFDSVSVAFGVRNYERLDVGLVEARRVLRPGGQLLVLEFFRDESRWRNRAFGVYFKHVLPRVGRWISGDGEAYTYLPRSVGRFVTRVEFETLLRESGFEDVRRREMTLGIATLFVARACPRP